MKTKHERGRSTIGPWVLIENFDGNPYKYGVLDGKELIHVSAMGASTVKQDKAVAKLIAAAPDLLGACQALHERIPWVHNAAITDDIEALKSIALAYAEAWNTLILPAIAKATGD